MLVIVIIYNYIYHYSLSKKPLILITYLCTLKIIMTIPSEFYLFFGNVGFKCRMIQMCMLNAS